MYTHFYEADIFQHLLTIKSTFPPLTSYVTGILQIQCGCDTFTYDSLQDGNYVIPTTTLIFLQEHQLLVLSLILTLKTIYNLQLNLYFHCVTLYNVLDIV